MMHGQQIMNGTVMIHSKMPTKESSEATSINGSPIRNPSGLQLSHILSLAQISEHKPLKSILQMRLPN